MAALASIVIVRILGALNSVGDGALERKALPQTLPMSRLLTATVLSLGLVAPSMSQSGALELFVGETLFVGGTRAALTWLHVEGGKLASGGDDVANPDGVERDRDVVVASWNTNLRRGLDLALVLPWVSDDATFAAGSGVLSTDEGGIGDLAFVLKQRVYNDVWNRGAWNVSVLGGVETPTGETSKSAGGELIPPSLQPGSGSWDPFVGVASTWEQGRFRFDSQVFWQTFGEGDQAFQSGDVVSVEFDVGYRALMTRYPGPTVSTKAGVRWRHRGRGEQGGSPLANSGGDDLSLIVAAGWHPSPEWDVSLRLELPTYQDLNGTQLETDYRALVGIGLRF
jgi:hypothetical protein